VATTAPLFVKNCGLVAHCAALRAPRRRLAIAAPIFLKNGDFVREIGASARHDDDRGDASGGVLRGFSGSRRAKSAGRS
jgi:hypothetical protein